MVSIVWNWGGRVFEAAARGRQVQVALGYTLQWASTNPGAGDFRVRAHRRQREANWQNYIQHVVSRYGSQVTSGEIWNERDDANFLKPNGGGWTENTYPGETARRALDGAIRFARATAR